MNGTTGPGGDELASTADTLLAPAVLVGTHELATIRRVAERFADALASGHRVYAFGAGHSKAVADELCHRAGGLPGFVSMNLDDLRTEPRPAHLQLSDSAPERDPRNGPELLALFEVGAGDALLIASQSGRNGAIVEMASRARELGVYVAAVLSRQHSRAVPSRHPSGLRLGDLADDVIDNHGPVGDAAVVLPNGDRSGAVSTISGALIAQLLSVAVARSLGGRGLDPGVIRSANVDHADPA
ncbi:sugar isomerase domain-containing protein [Jiangella asiatica]|uniref:Sugar isomerase domain-containing protein n=1 Tax=Jiangella asiatica TaxID=2530372 RepID=A0A4R5D412_9ACTN|nr:sugar isomerase domain-containing protein [Jiangella asiatica]TDE08129.1 sugar isomerase domain-containing protein [Jiangella asiatica]